MAKDKSILLVANARPFEIGKFYFFRDCRMRRFMEQAGTSPVYPPALRPWTETSAWLDAHSKLTLATMAAQGDSETTLAVAASEGSAVESRPGTSARESAQKARAAIDPDKCCGRGRPTYSLGRRRQDGVRSKRFLITPLRQPGLFARTNTEHAVFGSASPWRATRCNFRRVSARSISTRPMETRRNVTRRSFRGAGPAVSNAQIAAARRTAS
ncbi:hypothetical protein [Methylocystis echinoides]|uniref:hypothetical protein n=1 Tax=Methylocystis echinoides TaxID=29468 RepID=UPI003D81540E